MVPRPSEWHVKGAPIRFVDVHFCTLADFPNPLRRRRLSTTLRNVGVQPKAPATN